MIEIEYQLYHHRCQTLLKNISPSHDETWFVYIVPGFKNRKGKWNTLLPVYLEYIILIHFAMIVLVWIFSPILDAPWLHKMKDAILASPEYQGIYPSINNIIIAYMFFSFAFILVIWSNISNKLLLGHRRIIGIVDWGDLANPWETAYIANLQKHLQGINNRMHS